MSLHAPASRFAVLLLSSGLLLSACGSDSKDNSSTASQDNTGSQSASDTAGSGTAPAPTMPTASAAPKGSKALPGMPEVTNAADLKKEPTIAKGTGKAPDKLVIRDLVVGTGQAAVASDTVNVRYVGTLYVNGKKFDASWKYGTDPATFPLARVVPGFAGGIVGMKVGGRREIVIPGDLGYGTTGSPPDIGPNAVLVFVVDLVSLAAGQ
ncbi:MAG TPA: FKBP-type peptidyl-prolyl cis-trans isomerase [Sporichthyaceae bacterium]|nr:FKBP-type peptidyl-prolyl cis-trans isomerase [Sporichthyaceae bacterium]